MAITSGAKAIESNQEASALKFEQLSLAHLDDLASVLRHPLVYAHIDREVPSLDHFKLGLSRALAGPGANAEGQHWLNFLVRLATSDQMIGRLEASVHHGLAEVAFLFGPQHWGNGYAAQGLCWLHRQIAQTCGVSSYWACTIAANTRCQALLVRCGYQPAQEPFPPLLTYDEGDLVFTFENPIQQPQLTR